MLGLRVDSEQYLQNANQHKKTYRFAERLNGRFFVSGISGGFEKYEKLKNGSDIAPPIKKIKYSYQPVLERAQREEFRKEAEKLLELEEKLAEIQRIKEAKRRRDRQRQMKKLIFQSTVCLQRFWRKKIRQRREKAANLLITFLKAQKARQAFYTAAWAASVLKMFAVQASRRWRRWKFFQRQVKRVAAKNWYLIQEIASVWTQSRRNVTDQFVHHIVQQGMKNAKQEILLKQGKRKKIPAVKKDPSTYFAFFLTEGSTADSVGQDDTDSDYEDALATDNQSPNMFMRRQQSRYLQFLKSQENIPPPEKRKVYNFDDHKVKVLIKKHQSVLKKIENEEQLRAERVEKLRKKTQQEVEAKKEEEEKLKKQKNEMKLAYKKKLEEENQERIRNFQKLREKKLKQEEKRKREEKQEEEERKKMRAEDPLFLAKRLRDWQLHVQKLKKAKEAKHVADPERRPLHYNPTPEELAATEDRRKAKELDEAKLRDVMRQRIKEKMQLLALEKKQKEQEEKEKKEKKDQFMGSYQDQLQKQKEEFLKKQRDKEKQRKLEEKRIKQEQKEKDRALIDAILAEQEAKDAEELAKFQQLGDKDKRIIASAQDYDDQMPMEEFGFDDFIRKSLTQLYTRPPPANAIGPPQKWVPASLEEEKQIQNIKAKVVKTVIKKIPSALRNTPYFKHYFKHTVVNKLMEKGIAGAEDEALLHRQTEELLVQLQRQQLVQNDDSNSVIVAKAASSLLGNPAGGQYQQEEGFLSTNTNDEPGKAMISVPQSSGFSAQPMAPTPVLPTNVTGKGPLVKSRSTGHINGNGTSGLSGGVGVRGIKARKSQKDPPGSQLPFTSADDPNYPDERHSILPPSMQHSLGRHQQQQQQQQSLQANEADASDNIDLEDNEDLMTLIARAKQRLLQQETQLKEERQVHAMVSSQSQPYISIPLKVDEGDEYNVDAEYMHQSGPSLVPKIAATPIPMTSIAPSLPNLPSVQEFLKMQPGPPALPGAPPSLDNIASRYPISWEMPGSSMPSSSTILDRGASVKVPSKKLKKATATSVKPSLRDVGYTENDAKTIPKPKPLSHPKLLGNNTSAAAKTQKKEKKEVAEPEMTDKEIRARERQLRAQRKNGPVIKLKKRAPIEITAKDDTSPTYYDEEGEEQEQESEDELDENEEESGLEQAMNLDEYAFAQNANHYREKPGALPLRPTHTASDIMSGDEEEDIDNLMTISGSKPSTAGSGAGTSRSSRIHNKLHQYEGYEDKLQADYLALRKQFQEKLKAAAASQHAAAAGDAVVFEDDEEERVLGAHEHVHGADIDDSVLTRSITDLYVAVGEGSKDSQSTDNNRTQPADCVASEEELRRQLQVTTKDLLRAWALEDEMERQHATGGVEDEDDSAVQYSPQKIDGNHDSSEYRAWLRHQHQGQEYEEEEEEEEEFDPIQAHMAHRQKQAVLSYQQSTQKDVEEREEGDEEDDEDALYDEEKALMLAERRQRRRQEELMAMKHTEADKRKFWESLINGPK